MELFISNSYRGASLLCHYKTKSSQSKKAFNGTATLCDFSRTVSGLASPLFLVSPGSDREKLILSSSIYAKALSNYKDVVVTADAAPWCPFNSPPFHEHVMRRLDIAGLTDRRRFVCNPIPNAGETVAFKYSGGTMPQNMVFPVGSKNINWLTVLNGAIRFGQMAAKTHNTASDVMLDLSNVEDPRTANLALKRLRIWRSFDFIAEATRRAGMVRYEPFSVGSGLYDYEVSNMSIKGTYERSILYLGDHFSRETLLLNDIANGGYASDFWVTADAINRHYERHGDSSSDDAPRRLSVEDWTEKFITLTRFQNHDDKVQFTVEEAIREYTRVGEARKARLLEYAQNVLTEEQRRIAYEAFGSHRNEGSATALADAFLASPSRSSSYILLHSLLKLIQFDILHIVGYEAQRILIFKVFVPALLALHHKQRHRRLVRAWYVDYRVAEKTRVRTDDRKHAVPTSALQRQRKCAHALFQIRYGHYVRQSIGHVQHSLFS